MALSYYEKLKDPRWQEKRLRIMDRDGFCCTVCRSRDKTLTVHHGYYERGIRNPWDYGDLSLWTLCEDCHTAAQEAMANAHQLLSFIPPSILIDALQATNADQTACGRLCAGLRFLFATIATKPPAGSAVDDA